MELNGMPASKIIGIQFSILSPEEILRYSVAEITSKETYSGIKPKIGGLFDPRMGVLDPGIICPTDGQNYIDCPGYFGHINLARPVFYIQYLNTVMKIIKCVCIKCSRLLVNKDEHLNLLTYSPQDRWDNVFQLCNKVKRCGEKSDNGCGCLQPEKIKKEGFATLIAEWSKKDGSDEPPMTFKITAEVALKILKKITDDDVNFMGFSSIWSRPDWMICQRFAVPPPSVRPSVKYDAQQRSEDDITQIIINIIKYNTILKEKLAQKNTNSKIIDDWTSVLQYYIATMVDNTIPGADPVKQRSGRPLMSLTQRHKGKTGRIRGNLMGKRVDFSARSVITPDPELSITELGVPLKIAMNITKPVFVNKRNIKYLTYLVKNGPDEYPGAKILEKANGTSISLRYVDRENISINVGDTVHRHMLNGDYVLFNRQPTLHRMSMMAHKVRVKKAGIDTFSMNVAVTKPYNADFDGDEMNMHMPQNDEAEMELKYLAAIRNQIISPANNKSIIGIFQDSLLGSHLFTRSNVTFTRKQAMNLLNKCSNFDPHIFQNDKQTFTSFEVLSTILPPLTIKYKTNLYKDSESYETSNRVIEIVNGIFKRGQLEKDSIGGGRGLIQRINQEISVKDSQLFIDNLQAIVTEYMKTTGFSVGISDLISNEQTSTKISQVILDKKKDVANIINQIHLGVFENKSGRSNDEYFESEINNILNKATSDAGKIAMEQLNPNNRFVTIVKSGSKGSVLNISQMISCLGQQNVDNKRVPYSYLNRTLPHYKQFDDSPEARGFVENSFISGLTPTELFFHAQGGRTGLIDTAVKTSQTGYIQRRLVKALEDAKVCYDRTVRNNKDKIIQFTYGGTNFDTIHVENVSCDLFSKSVSEIYDYFNYNYKRKELKLIYDKSVLSRFNDEMPKLKERVKDEIQHMIAIRDLFIQKINDCQSDNVVYLPLSFERLITNIKAQFGITETFLTDITPLDAYVIIDTYYDNLNKTYQPCDIFKVMYYYFLNPCYLLNKIKLNRESLIYLLEKITLQYKIGIVNPGEMVGLIGAQSIGEPATQMTLNTFHQAGASKSNVTRGVPRLEELLSLTDKLKNPSITIKLKQDDEKSLEKAINIVSRIEHTRMRDIVEKAEIYYDPDDMATLIKDDTGFMEIYKEYQHIIDEAFGETKSEKESSNKWILRLVLDKNLLTERNITLEEIHYSLKIEYKDDIECFYNDLNNEEVVFRIRLTKINKTKTSVVQKVLDQEDNIYIIKNFQENLLNNIVLRGIQGIERVIPRKIQKHMIYNKETGDYDKEDICVLDTIGSNLETILSLDYVDTTRTYSNNVIEMKNILGIEAARKAIFNEFREVMEYDGGYINHHHLGILCDRMTINEGMVSIFRHGINKDDIGPIAKASFEETSDMLLNAAKHGELDELKGVSANVMCGQEGYYGTSSFQVYLNTKDINDMEEECVIDEEEEEDLFSMLEPAEDDACSVEKLKISHNLISEHITKHEDNKFALDI
jgi:DNA-directed RNA polymerase II subunit RPB1